MKICANCGHELNDDDLLCKECGKEATETQSVNTESQSGDAQMRPIEMQSVEQAQSMETQDSEGSQNNTNTTDIEASASLDEPTAATQTGSQPYYPFNNQPSIYQANLINNKTETPITPPPEKKARWPYVLLGMLAVLCLSAFLLYRMGNFAPPQTVKLAPEDTQMFISIKPNLLQMLNSKHIAKTFESYPETKKVMDKYKEEFTTLSNSSEEEMKSWFGREQAIIVPKMGEESVVIIVVMKDKKEVNKFVQSVERNLATEKKTYKNVTVRSNDVYSIAIVDNYLLFSTDEELLHSTIDRKLGNGGRSLADNAEFKKVVKSLPWNRSALCFYNLDALVKDIKQEADSNVHINSIESYRSFGTSMSIDKQGIRYNFIVSFNRLPAYIKDQAKQKADADAILNMLPDDTIGFVRSSYLFNLIKDDWEVFNTKGFPFADEFVSGGAEKIKSQFNLDFKTDVVDMLRGDAAFVVMPETTRFFNQRDVPISGAVLMGLNDQQKAQATIEKLVNFAQSSKNTVQRKQINGMPSYSFNNSSNENLFCLGIKNNVAVVGSSLDAATIIMEMGNDNINKQLKYQKTFEILPESWEPQMFVNIDKLVNLWPEEEMDPIGQDMLCLLKPLKSFGMATSPIDTKDNTIKGEAILFIN
ncbi:MAG: DUF3352 domain-containing protein [Methanobacterium sp.]